LPRTKTCDIVRARNHEEERLARDFRLRLASRHAAFPSVLATFLKEEPPSQKANLIIV